MEEVGRNLHPGVLALGYVKTTTSPLASSSIPLKVTLTPSCVSTSPPKRSRSSVWPTSIFPWLLDFGVEPLAPLCEALQDCKFEIEEIDCKEAHLQLSQTE